MWKSILISSIYVLCGINQINGQPETWGEWSPCTKSCDIGTRNRNRTGSTNPEVQSQYCNVQYCPDIGKSCDPSATFGCHLVISDAAGECINGTCFCGLGNGYNEYNCYPEYGNCIVRVDPPTVIGYKDDSVPAPTSSRLHSCTANDNTEREVHIIGIYGDISFNKYQVNILPRGPVKKPIILVLTAYEQTHWTVNTTVDLQEVIYGGYRIDSSTLESVGCLFTARKRTDLSFSYGFDTGGGNLVKILKTITEDYGPVTSFTGYYAIYSQPAAQIVLKVGDDPLAVIPREYVMDISNKTGDGQEWGAWTRCSQSCNIGTRSREKCASDGSLMQKEEEYCNMQYCPDNYLTCSEFLDCFGIARFNGNCTNGKCQCTMGNHYNIYNCYPEYASCIIREDPPTALGYKDPDPEFYYPKRTTLLSCTSNNNTEYEVHVIGIYGNRYGNDYRVSLVPRGPLLKPIVLVLASYEPLHWKINTEVDIHEIMYGGYRDDLITLEVMSKCRYNATKMTTNMFYGYGSDAGGGNTLLLLQILTAKYGPITSFTGYYELGSTPYSHIILEIGGNPLSVLPKNYMYNMSDATCSPEPEPDPNCKNYNPIYDNTWGLWGPCTKSCDIGTRIRENCNSTGQIMESEEEFCNTHYCPEVKRPCTRDYYCNLGSYAKCVDGTCQCTLGDYYNINNCQLEFGNCIIRRDPPTALGYRDPMVYTPSRTKLLSCTTADAMEKEIHVIGIYGDYHNSVYQINIKPRGIMHKPIVLILTSFSAIHWKINTTVEIQEVVYGGTFGFKSTVESASISLCYLKTNRRLDIPFSRGDDIPGTLKLMKKIYSEYGPITSFTGYYVLSSSPVSQIILEVGGNPLAVNPDKYNLPQSTCAAQSAWNSTCVYTNKSQIESGDENTWGSWTPCSQRCNVGTRIREKCHSTGELIQREEQYCNLKHCETKSQLGTCSVEFTDCAEKRGRCLNGTCYCIQGEDYVMNDCLAWLGSCLIRKDPRSAVGYKDPLMKYFGSKTLYSCTSDENPYYEVHIISIHGDVWNNKEHYRINVVPRGLVSKPIILVLASHDPFHWSVNASVGLYKVIYGGKNKELSSIDQNDSYCRFPVQEEKIDNYGYGLDPIGARNTMNLMKSVAAEYGPITSFTGYENLLVSVNVTATIILKVGGDPLAVLSGEYEYDTNLVMCTPVEPPDMPIFPPTTPPLSLPGTIEVKPKGSVKLDKGEHFEVRCYFKNNVPVDGTSELMFLNPHYKPLSGDFTVSRTVDTAGTRLSLIVQKSKMEISDSGVYTCVEMKTGKTASLNVQVSAVGPVAYWGFWGVCLKPCGIGTSSRRGYNYDWDVVATEWQYCSLKYCPKPGKHCSGTVCDIEPNDGNGKCYNNTCVCRLGKGYDPNTCYPTFGNCFVRKNPVIAIGYEDQSYTTKSDLYSCTANDNLEYEVHVIGIYGKANVSWNHYTVTILPRGQVKIPIILYLTSYYSTWWNINSTVDIATIYYNVITEPVISHIRKSSSTPCEFQTVATTDFPSGYGDDTNGGSTYQNFVKISKGYGPITSFTGYYSLEPLPPSTSAHITLYVGGDPLSTILPNSSNEFQSFSRCIYPPTTTIATTTQWVYTEDRSFDVRVGAPTISVVIVLAIAAVACFIRQRNRSKPNSDTQNNHTLQYGQSVGVVQQDNFTNLTYQENYQDDMAQSPPQNQPPPSYQAVTEEPQPPSYETVMKDIPERTKL